VWSPITISSHVTKIINQSAFPIDCREQMAFHYCAGANFKHVCVDGSSWNVRGRDLVWFTVHTSIYNPVLWHRISRPDYRATRRNAIYCSSLIREKQTITRTNLSVLPFLFRKWGTRLDPLIRTCPPNNAAASATTVVFSGSVQPQRIDGRRAATCQRWSDHERRRRQDSSPVSLSQLASYTRLCAPSGHPIRTHLPIRPSRGCPRNAGARLVKLPRSTGNALRRWQDQTRRGELPCSENRRPLFR